MIEEHPFPALEGSNCEAMAAHLVQEITRVSDNDDPSERCICARLPQLLDHELDQLVWILHDVEGLDYEVYKVQHPTLGQFEVICAGDYPAMEVVRPDMEELMHELQRH